MQDSSESDTSLYAPESNSQQPGNGNNGDAGEADYSDVANEYAFENEEPHSESEKTNIPFYDSMPSPQDLAAIESALYATEADLLVVAPDSPEISTRANAVPAPSNAATGSSNEEPRFNDQYSRYTLAQATNGSTADQLASTSSSTGDIDFTDEAAAANADNSPEGCNDQAGTISGDEKNCCPSEEVTQLEGVYFETNKADLTPESRSALDKAASNLALCEGQSFEIAGHTDARASESYNLSLSQARAEAVRSYLINKGVNPSQLAAKGYGETQPLNRNTNDEEALKENRRVELRHIK